MARRRDFPHLEGPLRWWLAGAAFLTWRCPYRGWLVAGTLDLAQLTAERAGVKTSGRANVVVDVTQAFDVHVSGAGTVTYPGNPPDVKQDVSGAGTLAKR